MKLNDLNIFGHNVIEIVFVTFIISLVMVQISKKIAIHIGAIDKVNDDQKNRRIHKEALPRLGGIGIFFAFLVGYMMYGPINEQMVSVIIGAFILIVVGMWDDIKSMKQRYKLLSHIIAAGIVVFYGGLVLNDITFFGFEWIFPAPFNYIFTTFFIVGAINAINFIDGLDGLSSGIGSIYFLTIGIIALILNQLGGLDIILAFIMLGATLGHLVHNFYPATTFIGDCGSQFLGYMIAIIALLGFKGATLTSLIIPLLILFIPIMDTLFAILRRLIKKESLGNGDMEHFHHQFLKMRFSVRTTVLIIYLICALFAAVSIFYVLGDTRIAIIIYVALMFIVLFFVAKTNILFEHKKKEKKKVSKK